MLVAGNYQGIVEVTKRVRLTANEIKRAVDQYHRTLVEIPDGAFDLTDVVEVKGALPKQWSIRMPLWTEEEGRSDLTLELTVIQEGDDFRIELDDIHVL